VAGTRHGSYQPIFPYFGGKSPVANLVWDAIGDVPNYVEPFFGSGAVLFLRPGGAGHIETVNDADGFVANFWRALQRDEQAVAAAADNPVNEADLHARHLWLIGQRERITDRVCGDEDFYDAKAAGWWAWGLCCWIGSGWCSGNGPWQSVDGQMVLRNPGQGVNRQLPHLGDPGKGVNRQLPHLGNPGKAREPETPDEITARRSWLVGYLRSYAARLRNVRVCCGDWSRVCGPSVTFRHGPTGVFLDPPYADSASRTANLYATDCEQVAHRVREWAIEQGKNKLMRIVLAGYEGEHEMPSDWRVVEWQATGGYGLISDDEEETGRANRKRERLWLSPACNKSNAQRQRSLLGDA
jgi:site-specific DNA-adenine methylase